MQMIPGAIQSLLLTAFLLGSFLGFLSWYRRRIEIPCANVWGADPIAMAFAEFRTPLSGPLAACVTWLLVSVTVSLSPWFMGKGTYLLDPVQSLVALNYCLAVPILVGVYVHLVRGLGHFEAHKVRAGGSLLLRSRSFWVFQLCLILAALVIQNQAIRSELEHPSPCSPWTTHGWIWQDADTASSAQARSAQGRGQARIAPGPEQGGSSSECSPQGARFERAPQQEPPAPPPDLSVVGILYYALRGMDTALALGLIGTIFFNWFRLESRFRGEELTDHRYPGLGPSEHVQRVGSALLGSVVVGSAIATLYGISLAAHARRLLQASPGEVGRNDQLELFTHSTWAFWAIATLIISFVAGGSVLWLRAAIVRELREREAKEFAQLRHLDTLLLNEPTDIESAKEHARSLDLIMGIRTSISSKYCAAQAWPLPRGAVAALGFATLAQAGNILLALYTFSQVGVSDVLG